MDNITDDDEYTLYWETNMFHQTEELDRYFDDTFSTFYDSSSSSADGAPSPATSKNIVSERNRRKKLNQRLFALRAVVPNISKMDKASIIKDANDYIQELHDEERRLQAEISEIEMKKSTSMVFDPETCYTPNSKRFRIDRCCENGGPRLSPLKIIELRVTPMGEKTVAASLTCNKRRDTMVKLCELFDALNLRITSANISAFSGRLLKTVFIEVDKEETNTVKMKIEGAISALNEEG